MCVGGSVITRHTPALLAPSVSVTGHQMDICTSLLIAENVFCSEKFFLFCPFGQCFSAVICNRILLFLVFSSQGSCCFALYPLYKLRPCPSYSRCRDRNNCVHWRSLYKGGGNNNTLEEMFMSLRCIAVDSASGSSGESFSSEDSSDSSSSSSDGSG